MLLLLLLGSVAARAEPLPNRIDLRVTNTEHVKAAVKVIRARLDRFGVGVEIERDGENGLRVRLPAMSRDQARRIERLLTSSGRVDLADPTGRVVISSEGILGLTTTLEEGRIRFRLRLHEDEREPWASAPELVVFRWDDRPVHYFRPGKKPIVVFPVAFPRDDLRCLFCCVLYRPLPVVEITERDFTAVGDPAEAWRELVRRWKQPDVGLVGEQTYRRGSDEAAYVARTRIVEREGRRLYLLEDSLDVPGHPEQRVRYEILCDAAWRMIEGRIRVASQTVSLEPEKEFLAPGIAIRVAPLLPRTPDRTYGPGGRLRVGKGSTKGTLEIRSPGRPAVVVVKGVRVMSLKLEADGEAFLRTR